MQAKIFSIWHEINQTVNDYIDKLFYSTKISLFLREIKNKKLKVKGISIKRKEFFFQKLNFILKLSQKIFCKLYFNYDIN